MSALAVAAADRSKCQAPNRLLSRKTLLLVLGAFQFVWGAPATWAMGDIKQLTHLYKLAENHPSVGFARSQSEIVRNELDAIEWGRYPSLSVNGAQPFDSASTLTFTVEQPVYTAGRQEALTEAGRSRLIASEHRTKQAILDIQKEVAAAYVEMLRAQRRVTDAEANIRELERLFGVIERRVNAEVSARAEQVLAQARLQQAISDRYQYLGDLHAAQNRLRSATGIDVSRVNPLVCQPNKALLETELVEQAYRRAPQLARLAAERAVSEEEVKVAQAERFPRIVLGAEHVSKLNLFEDADLRGYVGLQYQLQDGLSVNSRISAAQAQVLSVDEDERLARENIRQEIAQWLRSYRAASNQISPLSALVESNEGLIESYLRQYQAGKKSWLDVINAQREMIQARFLLTDSFATQCASAVALDLITGSNLSKEQGVLIE